MKMERRVLLTESFEPGKIGIATALFNSSKVLPDFFKSLEEQTYTNFIVYSVDNASADGSAALCRDQGSRYKVTENSQNTGFAQGTNQGIRQAIEDGCEYVLILNNDVLFEPDFLALLVEGLNQHHADMVAPLTYYFDPPNVIWAAGGRLQRLFGYRPVHLGMNQIDTGQFSLDMKIQFAPGSCILARREVFSNIGLLDETFFTYWEDTDFAARALKNHLLTYLIPQAKLWHKVSSLTGKNSPFQRYYAVRNHALYIHKHCSPLEAQALNALYLTWYRIAKAFNKGDAARIQAWKDGLELARTQSFKKP
ncbi:glycosyltransferase family 2 protein [Terriglobus sp. RCC_193]|uniref:glycosyltransferase family 2 protein n=1 Tax=Terriglobus sp. RCC_193 TaxID=3239218 RepID=UPI003524AC04